MLTLLEENLSNGESVLLTVKGSSMFPNLVCGIDRVLLVPCSANNVKIGDIILFKYQNEFILHRIIGINFKDETITAKGDNSARIEEIGFDAILALASKDKSSISDSIKRYFIILSTKLKRIIMKILRFFFVVAILLIFNGMTPVYSQNKIVKDELASMKRLVQDQNYQFDIVNRNIEDVLWYNKVGDVAIVDKVRLMGPPKPVVKKTGNAFEDEFLNNDFMFYAYIFFPRNLDQNRKYPLIVFSHGGVHGQFTIYYAHIIRELIAQGYIVIGPEFRGGTGYGKSFQQAIDYGGVENEDVLVSRDYMVDNYSVVDKDRVGLLGWSHGGMITLMNLLKYPDKYACGYAGVPVSDVTYRLEYHDEAYNKLFTADYHIGKSPKEAPAEYARRSPVSYAKDLKRPLMITTTLNDDDVSCKEVMRMIDSLKFYKKDFEYKVYDALSGSHQFERVDTGEATSIRYNVYKFLEKYLFPDTPFKEYKDMRKAGYYFN